MSQIQFGANDINQGEFVCEATLRAKLSNDPDQAVEDLNNKIDYLLDSTQQKDYLQSEMIRACPLVRVYDKDDLVVVTDNPVYEQAGIDITALHVDKPASISADAADVDEDEEATRQKREVQAEQQMEKQASEQNQKVEDSAQKKPSKKSLARQIYNRMNGSKRKEIIDTMVSELEISKAHASTYYQSIKSE